MHPSAWLLAFGGLGLAVDCDHPPPAPAPSPAPVTTPSAATDAALADPADAATPDSAAAQVATPDALAFLGGTQPPGDFSIVGDEPFTSAESCARVAALAEVKAAGSVHVTPVPDQADGAGGGSCTGSAYECVHWCRVDKGEGAARRRWRYYGADRTTLYRCKSAARWPCYEDGVVTLEGWGAGSRPGGGS